MVAFTDGPWSQRRGRPAVFPRLIKFFGWLFSSHRVHHSLIPSRGSPPFVGSCLQKTGSLLALISDDDNNKKKKRKKEKASMDSNQRTSVNWYFSFTDSTTGVRSAIRTPLSETFLPTILLRAGAFFTPLRSISSTMPSKRKVSSEHFFLDHKKLTRTTPCTHPWEILKNLPLPFVRGGWAGCGLRLAACSMQ